MNLDGAETLALQVLTFLLSDPRRVSRFMSLTGMGPDDIRTAAQAPWMQAATLEYLLTDESLLLVFCQETGANPMSIAPAHALLTRQDS